MPRFESVQIVVNTRLLLKNRLEGIGWFSMQTLSRITTSNKDVHFVFLFDRNFDESFIFSDNITPLILGPQARHPFLYYAWFEHSVRNILNKMQPDLFLSPDGFLSLGASCRQLPVIHDINFLHHPQDSKWLTARYYNYYFPRFAAKATRIATVSEYSKKDITDHYSIDPAKVDVVYNGINEEFRPLSQQEKMMVRGKYTRDLPFFIFVGSLHPRKNIPNLIRAFDLFREKSGRKFCLVLAGPSFWGTGEISSLRESSPYREDIILTGRLEAGELARLTAAAEAMTFVSYYEGFGIPLVEAMACGTPVICSDRTSLPEIAGQAGITVDPYSPDKISEAMMQVTSDEKLRSSLMEAGFERSRQFSWDRSAQLLWESVVRAVS